MTAIDIGDAFRHHGRCVYQRGNGTCGAPDHRSPECPLYDDRTDQCSLPASRLISRETLSKLYAALIVSLLIMGGGLIANTGRWYIDREAMAYKDAQIATREAEITDLRKQFALSRQANLDRIAAIEQAYAEATNARQAAVDDNKQRLAKIEATLLAMRPDLVNTPAPPTPRSVPVPVIRPGAGLVSPGEEVTPR